MQLIVNAARFADRPLRLSPRERQILALLCDGLSNKLICRRLGISVGTVKVHLSRIFRELGVGSRLQAVLVARDYGVANRLVEEAPEASSHRCGPERQAH